MQEINRQTSSAFLTIDLEALGQNYKILKQKAGPADVAGVLKANAYGLGVEPVFRTLRAQGCSQFFVATLDEALHLRALDDQVSIAVLGGLFDGAEDLYPQHNLTPVLNALHDITRYQNLAKRLEQALPAILHFDTGMNRLGLGMDETDTFLDGKQEYLAGLDIQYIMSHFACADDQDDPLTHTQYERFDSIATHFPDTPKSLANSPGLYRSETYCYNLVRPGIALYGGNPTPETDNPMNAVVSLDVRVLQTRNITKGETIGYGAGHKFEQDTQTATVALGYADGFLRSASSRAVLYWNGQPCPVLGRVSMDLVSVEIGHLSGSKPQPGDTLEVLGPNQSADDLAHAAGTIPYEILTSLGSRYSRFYKD